MIKVMSSVLVGALLLTGVGLNAVPVKAKERESSEVTVTASRIVTEVRTYTTSKIPTSITYAKDGWVGILDRISIEEIGLGKYQVTFSGTVVRDPGF
ncbi:hypothetical protein [Bacillus sp. NPDC077027]|uniref:hypothetical protein n=1 Tax=Bacillus sp. NPDC077027 TaxID=3390548 RepID=UPI003CFC3CA3